MIDCFPPLTLHWASELKFRRPFRIIYILSYSHRLRTKQFDRLLNENEVKHGFIDQQTMLGLSTAVAHTIKLAYQQVFGMDVTCR